MDAELQELRDLVAQLRADNQRLRQEQVTAIPGPSTAPSVSLVAAASSLDSAPVERLIFVREIENVPFLGTGQG